MGGGGIRFLKNLSWIGLCFGISKVFSSLAPIAAAKIMGPEVFGEASLVLTTAQLFYIVMLFGMNVAVVRYGAGRADPTREITTSVLITLAASVYTTVVIVLGRQAIMYWAHINAETIRYGLLFALAFTFYTLLTSALQALHRFKERGVAEVALSLLMVPGLVFGILLFGKHDTRGLPFAYIMAYIVASLPWVWMILGRRTRLSTVERPQLLEMVKYGGLACSGNIGFILIYSIQPLQVNAYLTATDVGVFRAYSMASIGMAAYFTTVFNTVFFPKASASTDRVGLWKTLLRVWSWGWIPAFLGFIVLELVLISLMGREKYRLDPMLVCLFAGASTLVSFQGSMAQIVNAAGVRGVGVGIVISSLSGVACFLSSAWFLPRFGVAGSAWAVVVAYGVALVGMLVAVRWLFKEADEPIVEG